MREDFLEQMARRYRRRGYRVYGLLPGLAGAPEGWRGPFPDLYAEKRRKRVASLVRGAEELRDPEEASHLQHMLRNRGVTVRIFVFSGKALRAARRMRRRIRWFFRRRRVQIHLVRRRRFRIREISYANSNRTMALHTKVVVAAIITGLLFFVQRYHFPSLFPGEGPLDSQKAYQPRDAERHVKEIRESERRAEKDKRKKAMEEAQGKR